jgi:hypothetical protein
MLSRWAGDGSTPSFHDKNLTCLALQRIPIAARMRAHIRPESWAVRIL